ncbi:MAG: hypothetical protein JO165_01435 [Candidatus Eremiobacteraeota bacterium]|nr:hypothetical protein [Candidatus Eremiobacteraeota bacterium]
MPRQIIDTESSRPAYVRRNIILAVIVAILLAAVLVGAYELFAAHHHISAGLPSIQGT